MEATIQNPKGLIWKADAEEVRFMANRKLEYLGRILESLSISANEIPADPIVLDELTLMAFEVKQRLDDFMQKIDCALASGPIGYEPLVLELDEAGDTTSKD